MKTLIIALITLGSVSAFGQINLTQFAVEQNSTTIEEYQVFIEGLTGRKCHFEDESYAIVNAFKGATYPSRIYSCGARKMTFTFECKGTELEERCKIQKVVIK